jgi:aspartate racemase
MAEKNVNLSLVMAHADTPTLLKNQSNNNVDEQVEIYLGLANKLLRAGVEYLAITSIAGHFCIEEFIDKSPLRVVNIIDSIKTELSNKNYKKIGMLGTKMVMETSFYSKLNSVEIVKLNSLELNQVHEAYIAMATAGFATKNHKAIFDTAAQKLINEHSCDCVLLAGTDLALVYNETNPADFPMLNCAQVHADDIIQFACV